MPSVPFSQFGIGEALNVGGSLISTAGAYHDVRSRGLELKSAGSTAAFESSMSAINARNAALDAQGILDEGGLDLSLLGMRYAQEKAGFDLTTGAAGVDATTGSAGEVRRSMEIARRIEAMSMNVGRKRAAGAARLRATDLRNRSDLARTSARNLRAAGSNRGEALAAGFGTLLGTGGRAIDDYSRTHP